MTTIIPNNLLPYREKAGLTQQALSTRVGIDRTLLSRLENGQSVPTFEQLQRLAAFFEASFEELYPDRRVLELIARPSAPMPHQQP